MDPRTTSDLLGDVLLSRIRSVGFIAAKLEAAYHGVIPIIAGDDSGNDRESD